MSQGREIELKLEVESGAAARLSAHPSLAAGPKKRTDQVSVYYDTPDGALREAGLSLRVRKAGDRHVQTVKQSAGTSAGLFDRPEWEWDVPGMEPDLDAAASTPLAAVLTKKVRKQLRPLIRVEAGRSLWMIEQDGTTIELILDEGNVAGGPDREQIAEVELELKDGDQAALFRLARELAERAPMRLGVLTKAERGYRLVDGSVGKATKAEPIALRRQMSAAEGFAAIAYACLRQFRLNEPIVTARQDPTALHQARVAMRRLRSGFTLFRPIIADDRYEQLRQEVRWFTDQLGDARNLDVLLKRFGAAAGDDPSAEALLTKLRSERETAYAQVLEALRSDRLRRLMLDLVEWVELGAWRHDNELASLPLPHFGSLQLDKRWKKVRKGGRELAALDPETRHRLRIEVKKLRYAVEFLASLTTQPEQLRRQKSFIKALEDLQERLGELNDLETARTLLGDMLGGDSAYADALRYAGERLEPPGSEAAQLKAAQKAHEELVEVGRFWR
jgi:inorganic triphosphatase YgiF